MPTSIDIDGSVSAPETNVWVKTPELSTEVGAPRRSFSQ
jgi:hypothetical protein